MIKSYRVNGKDLYQMDYRPHDEGFLKMYCLLHPHDPHKKGSPEHHMYDSGEICVAKGKEPRTLDRAKAIATLWMEGFSKYVRTGSFPQGGGRVKV